MPADLLQLYPISWNAYWRIHCGPLRTFNHKNISFICENGTVDPTFPKNIAVYWNKHRIGHYIFNRKSKDPLWLLKYSYSNKQLPYDPDLTEALEALNIPTLKKIQSWGTGKDQ